MIVLFFKQIFIYAAAFLKQNLLLLLLLRMVRLPFLFVLFGSGSASAAFGLAMSPRVSARSVADGTAPLIGHQRVADGTAPATGNRRVASPRHVGALRLPHLPGTPPLLSLDALDIKLVGSRQLLVRGRAPVGLQGGLHKYRGTSLIGNSLPLRTYSSICLGP